MADVGLEIITTIKGRILKANSDADQVVKTNMHNGIQRLLELGNQHLAGLLRKSPEGVYKADGGSTGNYRRNVRPVWKDQLSALITDGGVIYGPWLEGTSSRNETTRFKGYASFRKTVEWLSTQSKDENINGVRLLVSELVS